MRCYVVSILHNQANVAFCETGEMTKTKKLKDIPEKYKHIPVITFEAEVKCICPYGKLQHLMKVNIILTIFVFFPTCNYTLTVAPNSIKKGGLKRYNSYKIPFAHLKFTIQKLT